LPKAEKEGKKEKKMERREGKKAKSRNFTYRRSLQGKKDPSGLIESKKKENQPREGQVG